MIFGLRIFFSLYEGVPFWNLGAESVSRPIEVVGRSQFLTAVGQTSLLLWQAGNWDPPLAEKKLELVRENIIFIFDPAISPLVFQVLQIHQVLESPYLHSPFF